MDMIIDLSRILEMLTKWVPEIFLRKDTIHANRLLDYLAFLFKSIFTMGIKPLFISFSTKIMTRGRTLPQFLAPFIGILVNLYRAITDK